MEDTDVPSPADLAGDDAIWQDAGGWNLDTLQKGDQPFLVRRLPPQTLDRYCLCMLAALHRLDKNPSCRGGWVVLQFLPRLTLRPAPEPVLGSRWTQIEARLHKFQRGEWVDLFEEAWVILDTGGPIRHQADDEGICAWAEGLVKKGNIAKAVAALRTSPLAEPTQATLEALQAKHPAAEERIPAWVTGITNSDLSTPMETLREILAKCPNGVGARPSGTCYEHLRDRALANEEVLLLFAKVVNRLLSSFQDPHVQDLHLPCHLIALEKPHGGVRPIAIGEALLRVVAKAALQSLVPKIRDFFLPVQFGVAVPGGAECIIHTVRSLLREDERRIALQLDVENAFNSVERQAFLSALQWSNLSSILPLVCNLYDGPSCLLIDARLGQNHIQSSRGVRQGDPLGPLLFAAAIQPALLSVAVTMPEVAVVAYADDITIVGPREAASRAFCKIAEDLAVCGLRCNISKSAAWSAAPAGEDEELPLGLAANPGGIRVLGSPIGGTDFCTGQVRTTLEEAASPLPLIAQLNLQHAALIVSHSNSRRISYMLRTTPAATLSREEWRGWSEALVGVALTAAKLRIPTSELEQSLLWRQATLPIRLGGLGIIDPISEAPATYIASVTAACSLLKHLNLPPGCLLHRATTLLSREWSPPPPDTNHLTPLEEGLPAQAQAVLEAYRAGSNGTGNLQLCLSKIINQQRAVDLLGDTVVDRPGTNRGLALRLISLKGSRVGDWLHAVPTRGDLSISPGQFSLALGLRLGLEIPVADVCPCKRSNSTIGDKSLPNHLLRCQDGGDAVRTHNALVFVALRMASKAGFKTFHETSSFSPPVLRKRADLAIRDPESGETWVTDVTITDPVLQNRDSRARRPPGWAAEEASQRKHRLYEGRPTYAGFFGLAVETYGAMAADTLQFLRMLATHAAKTKFRQGRLTTTAARLTAHYRQRWYVMLQRSQAISLLSKSYRAAEAAYLQAAADPWAPRLGDLWQMT
ncbi:unnamed protein product [Closterium sp. NIES-54]